MYDNTGNPGLPRLVGAAKSSCCVDSFKSEALIHVNYANAAKTFQNSFSIEFINCDA